MKGLRRLTGSYKIMSGFCIILGIAFIIKPDLLIKTLGVGVGGLLVGYGLVRLVTYIRSRDDSSFVFGVISCAIIIGAGAFVMARPAFIPKVLALVFGFYMLLSGAVNLRSAFYMKRSGYGSWAGTAVLAGVTLFAGLALLGNPLMLADTATRILGVCLLVSGVMNILGSVGSSRAIKRSGDDRFIDI